MTRFLLALVCLVAIYLAVLVSVDPWDVGMGIAFGGGLLWATRGFVFGGDPTPLADPARRLVAFVPFVAAAVADIVRGTWEVALVVLHLRPLNHPGIVAVPIGDRSRLGVAVSALVTTLSPGSFLVDVDEAQATMLIHVLDASDPDGVRAAQERFYQRYQRPVFP